MATIPTYVAKRGLDADGIPNSTIVPHEAQEWGRVGDALQDVGASLLQRQQQKEDFLAENQYRRFKLELGHELENQKQNMPEGGIGFHDGFMGNVFKPRRDEFLSKVPPRLRERFATLLDEKDGSDFTDWSTRAATAERDETYRWATDQVKVTQQDLANAISMNPEQYDDLLTEGKRLIESAPIPTLEKKQLLRDWENAAQIAHLQRMMQDDPELVLKSLGANPNLLTPSSQFELLRAAVEQQETRGNPYQISEAGAIGAMQVMPGTAREIAKELGDENFPMQGDPEQVARYLMRPDINREYGAHYLRKMMRMFPNDVEAALIGYHSGPGTAKKWVEAGRDDAVLGPVGRKYYREVIARLPGGVAPDGSAPAGGDVVRGSPGDVKLVWIRDGGARELKAGDAEHDKISPELLDRVRAGFAGVGLKEVRIRSGHRNVRRNKKAGGADKSQHLTGNAVDIDVSGLSRDERVRLIASLSAAGITGIGVYSNSIHADLGGRRAWGPSHGKETVPQWAATVIAAHRAGKATVPLEGVRTVGRYSTLPYDKRQQFIQQADTALTQRMTAAQRGQTVERVQIRSQMEDELARVRATGAGSGNFDETKISTLLGEDDYVKWAEKRVEAQRTYTALQGMREMSPADLSDRIDLFKPDPASDSFASQQRVYTAVVNEADRITRMRANAPDKAAMEYPDVKAAHDAVQASLASGNPKPEEVQAFVRLMLQKQKEFGVKHSAAAPIPSAWAFDIGQALTRVPEVSGKNLEDVRAAVAVQYEALREFFGDYADDVIIYALSQYKGVSKANAELITSFMQQISIGGDPFKPRRQSDADQVESASGGFFDWLFGNDEPEVAQPPSAELVLRVVGRLGDIDDPAEEALLVEQYGQAAVDAAKAQLKRDQ